MNESSTAATQARGGARLPTGLRLFLVSFLVLFFELACIRWFGSTVIFLTFFTNLVLMAAFLGVSVGCLAASRKVDWIDRVLPLTLIAVVLAGMSLMAYCEVDRFAVDVGGQASPQQIFFGTEYRISKPTSFLVPVELIAGTFFVLIALMFVGLGQELGRAFDASTDRVRAYSLNLLGSLAGIGAFSLASYLWTPPVVWFGLAGALCVPLTTSRRLAQSALALGLGLFILSSEFDFRSRVENLLETETFETTWSPYYKVSLFREADDIAVNNIPHQRMQASGRSGIAYRLPHLLNRDSGGTPFRDVLIIGAGSGNDVAAALAMGAEHVDAVEIDPVIAGIGRKDHPDRPYSDPRVTLHLDDGRSFVRKTDRRYDLVIYALVDSLVLHSGYSSLRLESYLFTEQAFRDVKNVLKPDGVFAMYNHYRQGWVVGRLAETARRTFGEAPLVFSVPYREAIRPADSQFGAIGFVLAGAPGSPIDRIRSTLRTEGSFWAHPVPAVNLMVRGFGRTPPEAPKPYKPLWSRVDEARVETQGIGPLPTDAWPFLYLREPVIPWLNVRGMAIVAVASLAIWLAFAPRGSARPDLRMFFLGAGFMLLETKGVVHMALLFGSTWVVNSVVFAAVLSMALLANLFVLVARPRRPGPFYFPLVLALAANVLVPMGTYLALPPAARVAASCAVVFLPVFFAGVIFATSFRDAPRPDVALGWNIAGAILGGLTEFASLVVGFDALLAVAIAFYLLSAVLAGRGGSATTAGAAV